MKKRKLLTQPAITCSNLTIETLEQRCEICSKLTIKTAKRHYWHWESPLGIHSFNRKVEQRHAAKMFGSFPSKFEGEMLQLRFGI